MPSPVKNFARSPGWPVLRVCTIRSLHFFNKANLAATTNAVAVPPKKELPSRDGIKRVTVPFDPTAGMAA